MKDAIFFPILRAKQGEMVAVGELSAGSKVTVRPMFDIPDYREQREESEIEASDLLDASHLENRSSSFDLKPSPRNAKEDEDERASVAPAVVLSGIVATLARTWGTKLHLYLDLSRHEPDEEIGNCPAVAHLFHCARQAGLLAIPVAAPKVDRSAGYLSAVAAIAHRDQRGLALRLNRDHFIELDSLDNLIDDTLQALEIAEEWVDLFLDTGPLDKLPLKEPLQKSLREEFSLALLALDKRHFRNIVLASSSIPKQYQGAPHRLANNEFVVWSQLVGLPSYRSLKLSSYGCRYAHQNDGGPSGRPPARIHLVTPEEHLLFRGEPHRYQEFCTAAAHLFEDFQQSFGFKAIRDCAQGLGDAGRATEWVIRDTAMHVEVMSFAAQSRLSELDVLRKLDFETVTRLPQQQPLIAP